VGILEGIGLENEDIQNKVGVASLEDKMREARPRLFEHVKRRCSDALVQGVRG